MSARHARNQAEFLISSLGIKEAPIDVKAIAEHLGISVISMDLEKDISGLLITNIESTYIVTRKGETSKARERFTIAHELGHYYLGHQFEPGEHVHVDRGHYVSQRSPKSSTGENAKEIEANQFAASLLMPLGFIRSSIYNLGTEQLLDSHVEQLAEDFKVSVQAMTIRLSTLGFL